MEIALQYHIAEHPDTPWLEAIIPIQSMLNNSRNASTGKTPTELMYGMKVNEPLLLIGATGLYPQVSDLAQSRDLHQRKAQDTQMFAVIWVKRQFDSKHKKINLKGGDLVYLRLHWGYNLPGLKNPKLLNQRVDLFKGLKKISMLADRLEIPWIMQIHPVISIAHLEPYPNPKADPYHCP